MFACVGGCHDSCHDVALTWHSQGTGAVVTTGFINGMKAQKTELKDARIVFFGAGSSAVGVAKSIASYIELKGGVSAEEARKVVTPSLWPLDTSGLRVVTAWKGTVSSTSLDI